ncbi:MAG TPA: metallophosphoesterase [Bacillota bacterium]|nr:metallophosphoesterase [Bacillota bacterium]
MKKTIVILLIFIVMTTGHKVIAVEEKEPKYTFAVISDIHIQAEQLQNQKKFERALQDLSELPIKPQTLVINGDLTEGRQGDYDQLEAILRRSPHPANTFFTIGNHEFYQAWVRDGEAWNPETFPNGETEQASIRRFLQWTHQPKVYYNQTIQAIPFLFLGSEHYRQTNADIREDAYLSTEQLEWLKQQLERGKNLAQPIFVFLHQPLPKTVSGTYVCCLNNRAVVQHEELKKLLNQYPNVFFFSGHTHLQLKLPKTIVQDGFTSINSSSVSQPWDDDNQGGQKWIDPSESEGMVVEVFEDHVDLKGRDFYRRQWIKGAEYSIRLEKPWYHFVKNLISRS